MKTQKSEAVEKQGHTNLDPYSKIAAIRLIKGSANEVIDTEETIKLKKYFYLSSVVSYEEGHSHEFSGIDGPTIYIVCEAESFFIMGDIEEFNKKMNDYISAIRKLQNPDINSSEGA